MRPMAQHEAVRSCKVSEGHTHAAVPFVRLGLGLVIIVRLLADNVLHAAEATGERTVYSSCGFCLFIDYITGPCISEGECIGVIIECAPFHFRQSFM